MFTETFTLAAEVRDSYEEFVSGQLVVVSVAVHGGPTDGVEWSDGTPDTNNLMFEITETDISFTVGVA